jgi:hypothetical protein
MSAPRQAWGVAAVVAPEGPERQAGREREQADRRDVEVSTKLKGRLDPQLGELIRFQASAR